MGLWLSIDGDSLSRGSRDKSGCGERRLPIVDDSPLIFADSGLRIGCSPTHQKGDQARAVSVLARLLLPFAEARAEETAKALLGRFGTLERVLSASEELLHHALPQDALTVRQILAAKALVLAGLHESIARTPLKIESTAFQSYLVAKFRGKAREELHAIFVDGKMGFLSEDLVSIGSGAQVDARVSGILRRGLELAASGFLLVHNHPSQSPKPSACDVRSTKQTMIASRSVGISLIDHLIVAGSQVTSMKELQLI